jgi:phospholipase C
MPEEPPGGSLGNLGGNYIGAARCQAMHRTAQPPVPYGPDNANADVSKLVEEGFKQVRGSLTEGRYLTFEMNGFALTNAGDSALRVSSTHASQLHDDIKQRWVIYRIGDESGESFTITSAVDGRYVSYLQGLTSYKWLAETYTITDLGNGKGYNLRPSGVLSLAVSSLGDVFQTVSKGGFQIFSVTYHS